MYRSDSVGREGAPSGLPATGTVPWGTHMCHLYRSRDDLREALVPYFRAGLMNGEQCLWITSKPLEAPLARAALAEAVPDLAAFEARGQLELIDAADWYAHTGSMDAEAVLSVWIDRARRALDDGYTGLRITGNTYWLEQSQWEAFAEYEAAVHRAFHGIKIVALCSYSLDRCSTDDVLAVLRNHTSALIKRNGSLVSVDSATQLVDALRTPAGEASSDHVAFFYDDHRYPARALAEFFAEGVAAGGSAVAFATRQHGAKIQQSLRDLGERDATLRVFDANDLLAGCRGHGRIDVEALRPFIRSTVDDHVSQGRRLHLYGEVVDILCREGHVEEALALERIWDEIIESRPVSLVCGYEISSFERRAAEQAQSQVCGAHDDVLVDEGASRGPRFVASGLAREFRRRRKIESARTTRTAVERESSRRIALLQRVTSALSEIRVFEQVAELVDREICVAVGASYALLVASRGDDDDDALESVYETEPRGGAFELAAETYTAGRAAWLEERRLAAVPLRVAGRVIGSVVFGFGAPVCFDTASRAFIEDVVRQIALTVDRARLNEEAERQRRTLDTASRAKDHFIAMLGHELRNPLAAIRTAAEILKLDLGGDRVRRTQAVLERQTAHMSKLVDGLLEVSRVMRGKITLQTRRIDLRSVLLQTANDLLEADRARVHVDAGEVPLWIDGDPDRLEQILDNLLSNALKFTAASGRISITANHEGSSVVVVVSDTGIGIGRDLLPHVFEPFHQGAQELARSSGGLGLGLALVKALVELHGGEIAARSNGEGEGAEFELRFDAVDAPAQREAADAQPASGPLRLMVVEDNVDAADLLRDVLETVGHRAEVAYEGDTAMEVARRFGPHVVICDIGLPGDMSGYDVARAFRRDAALKGAYLIALTGYGRPEDVQRALGAGFDAHLTKPIDMAAIDSVLAKAAGAR